MTRKTTITIIVLTVLSLICWDVYVWMEPSPDDTISEVIHSFGRDWLIIPVMFGFLLGHFFPIEAILKRLHKFKDD